MATSNPGTDTAAPAERFSQEAFSQTVVDLGLKALSLSLDELFEQAVSALKAALGTDCAIVSQLLPDSTVVGRIAVGEGAEILSEPTLPDPNTLPHYVLSLGEPVVFADLAGETRFFGPRLRRAGLSSGLMVTIPDAAAPFGFLGAFSRAPRDFESAHVRLFQAVANVLAAAVQREHRDRALLASERWFRALTEHSHDMTTVFDRTGRILYSSPVIEQTLGYRPEDRTGGSVFDNMHPEDAAVWTQALQRLEGVPGGRMEVPFRIRTSAGDWRFLHCSLIDLSDDPTVGGIVANAWDVTERIVAQEALLTKTRQQEAVVELGHLALSGARLDDLFRRAMASTAAALRTDMCVLLEWDEPSNRLRLTTGVGMRKAAIGDTMDVRASDSLSCFVFEHGQAVIVDDISSETRFQMKDARFCSAIGVPIGGVPPYGVLVVASEKKRAFSAEDVAFVHAVANTLGEAVQLRRSEAALASSAEWYRATTANAFDSMVMTDQDGTITFIRGPHQVGLPEDDRRIGSNVLELVYPDDHAAFLEHRAAILAAPGQQRRFHLRARPLSNEWREMEVTATNLLGHPDVKAIVFNVRDVTEQRQFADKLLVKARQQEAINALGQAVLGGASVQEAMETATELLRQTLDVSVCSITEWRADEGQLLMRATRGFKGSPPSGLKDANRQSFTGFVFQQGRTVIVEDAESDDRFSWAYTQDPLKSALGVIIGSPPRGTLVVASTEKRAYSRDDIDFVEAMANILAQALSLEESVAETARLYHELADRERQLADFVGQLILTQEEERRRVAYDIHDGLAQVAAATHQRLSAFNATHKFRSPSVTADLARITELARKTVVDARRVIADLRPLVLDDFGLTKAIELELETLSQAGWTVRYRRRTSPDRLPSVLETALFRIAQEAVTNIRKYTSPTRVHVTLLATPGKARLAVQDWGPGFDAQAVAARRGPGERVGHAGMQERVRILGGRLLIRSAPGQGTRIQADVPLA